MACKNQFQRDHLYHLQPFNKKEQKATLHIDGQTLLAEDNPTYLVVIFDRVSQVQNQATLIITGAMKSTPIMELETITGLQSLDDRRDLKLLSQAAKFKRLQDHLMRQRLSQPTKGRLKRESFIYQSRILERRQEDILDHDPKEIPPVLPFLPGVSELLPSFGVPSQVLVR